MWGVYRIIFIVYRGICGTFPYCVGVCMKSYAVGVQCDIF